MCHGTKATSMPVTMCSKQGPSCSSGQTTRTGRTVPRAGIPPLVPCARQAGHLNAGARWTFVTPFRLDLQAFMGIHCGHCPAGQVRAHF